MRSLVYVSGPITQHPNGPYMAMRDGITAGNELFDLGYAPVIPHLTVIWEQEYQPDPPRDYEDWMDLDFSLIARCDAVLRLTGHSPGGDREVAFAEKNGVPVYHDVRELVLNVPCETSFAGVVRERVSVHHDTASTAPASGVPGPIARALGIIGGTFQKKNADYADDKKTWDSNFRDVSEQMGWDGPAESCEALIAVKQARLKSMRANGRLPQNESVQDTKLDRAVYSVIALAIDLEDADA